MPKTKPRTWKRKALDAGINMAVSALKRRATQKRVANKERHGSNNPGLVTSQLDVSTTRKRKSKQTLAKLKRQRRFKEKITKALLPDVELNVYSENFNNSTYTTTVAGTQETYQYVSGFTYMVNTGVIWSSTENTGYILGRYRNIAGSNNATATAGAKSVIQPNSFKLRFMASKTELSLTNTSSVPIVIDLYECVAAKDIANTEILYNTPYKAWTQCLLDAYTPTDAAPTVPRRPLVTDSGQTPYDCPQFGSYWKILKKTRILLPSLNTTEYLMLANKFTLDGDKFNSNYAIKGITKGILIVGGIGDNTGISTTIGSSVYRVVAQKTWHFKFNIGDSELPQRPTAMIKQGLAPT